MIQTDMCTFINLSQIKQTAVMFTFYLRDFTDFPVPECYPENIIGALLLRHMGQIINNAHTMYGIVLNDGAVKGVPLGHLHEQIHVEVIASALFPRVAMLNHSCDPNIRNCFNGNWLTIRAVRSIGDGEEIFNGYCPSYKLLDTKQRRELLCEQYGFDCDCSRCADSENALRVGLYHYSPIQMCHTKFVIFY